jgi:hypothetical protein
MKAIIPVLGAALLATGIATPAFAEDSQSVDIIGTAAAFCTLPTSWHFQSSTNNVSASQFSGTTWSINPTLLADNTGAGISSSTEVAIRVRGTGSCNTSHTITLTSVNGGLANTTVTSPPAGFQRTRRMTYDANWTGTTAGVIRWVPTAPGDSTSYDYVGIAPPGIHDFDVRMGLLRDPTTGPMLAGGYSDNLIITISIPG